MLFHNYHTNKEINWFLILIITLWLLNMNSNVYKLKVIKGVRTKILNKPLSLLWLTMNDKITLKISSKMIYIVMKIGWCLA